jgi:hypothetical protein
MNLRNKMSSKTTHVIPVDDGWLVRKSGNGAGVLFPTQKEATDRAIRISKAGQAGEVVVFSRTGLFRVAESHGLLQIQRSRLKSKLGRNAIRRAVGKVVLARLMAE